MKKILFFFLILSLSKNTCAQKSYGGIPYSFQVNSTVPSLPNYTNIDNVNTVDLPNLDNIALNQYADSISDSDTLKKISLYGKEIIYDIDFISSASYQIMDSTKVWRLKIQSPSAYALQVFFSKFKLDISGSLFIYDEDKHNLIGSFDYRNSKDTLEGKDGKFGISPFYGNNLIIEYNQSIFSNFTPKIHINSFVHVFDENFYQIISNNKTSQSQTLDCEISVKCSIGNNWQSESNSVAYIMYSINNGWYGFGTGSMINNTLQDGTPYFLTAGHLFKEINNTYSSSVILADPNYLTNFFFIFKYETLGCTTPYGISPKNFFYSVSGGQILSSKYTLFDDYALVKLDADKNDLAQWGVCYNGWNRSTTVGASQMPITLIHHPDGKEKSISISENSLMPTYSQYNGSQILDPNGKFYKTIWAIGSSESGSSGSPCYDNINRRLIGLLSGGAAACVNGQNNQLSDYIYKFSSAWSDGGFAQWLAPNGSAQLTLNTYCPPNPSSDPLSGSGSGNDNPTIIDPNDPCNTVGFTINGENPYNKIINVCTSDIWLTPKSPDCSLSDSKWHFKVSTQNRWCGQISHQWASARTTRSLFNTWCFCTFLQLFVSVQECDYNLNLVGPEYSNWYYIYDGDLTSMNEPDNFKSFNLNGYFAPQGLVLNEGKYYKIKIGTHNPNIYPSWHEFSGFVKTFATGTNVIQNQIINRNEVGTNITIINSFAPLNSGLIKVAAENTIKIQNDTKLQTGRYYIEDLDCNSIKSFRSANPDSSSSSKDNAITNVSTNNFLTTIKKNRINNTDNLEYTPNLFPNPSNQESYLKINLKNESKISSTIYDVSGKKIIDIALTINYSEGEHIFSINTKNMNNGIYLIKTYINYKLYTNKLIVNHE